jgi:hypothetical protein
MMQAFRAKEMACSVSQYSPEPPRRTLYIPQCVTVKSVGLLMQMIHSNAANLTGLFASASFCALINSACSLARNASYCLSSFTSTRSTNGILSRLCCLVDEERELFGRAALLARPSPGVAALRFLLGGGAPCLGGEEVKSTTEEERVVGGIAGEFGLGGLRKSSKGSGDSEPATRYCEMGGTWRLACWLLGGGCSMFWEFWDCEDCERNGSGEGNRGRASK